MCVCELDELTEKWCCLKRINAQTGPLDRNESQSKSAFPHTLFSLCFILQSRAAAANNSKTGDFSNFTQHTAHFPLIRHCKHMKLHRPMHGDRGEFRHLEKWRVECKKLSGKSVLCRGNAYVFMKPFHRIEFRTLFFGFIRRDWKTDSQSALHC